MLYYIGAEISGMRQYSTVSRRAYQKAAQQGWGEKEKKEERMNQNDMVEKEGSGGGIYPSRIIIFESLVWRKICTNKCVFLCYSVCDVMCWEIYPAPRRGIYSFVHSFIH